MLNSIDLISLGFNASTIDDYEHLTIIQWEFSEKDVNLELLIGLITQCDYTVYFMGRIRRYTHIHTVYDSDGDISELILGGYKS